ESKKVTRAKITAGRAEDGELVERRQRLCACSGAVSRGRLAAGALLATARFRPTSECDLRKDLGMLGNPFCGLRGDRKHPFHSGGRWRIAEFPVSCPKPEGG